MRVHVWYIATNMAGTPQPPSSESRDIEKNKDVAAFSYIWIMAFVVYFARKESPFARYHSKQGIVLFLLSSTAWWMPIIGHFLALVAVGGMVLGFMNAAQGRYADVPLVGRLAKGQLTMHELAELTLKLVRDAVTHVAAYLRRNEGNGAKHNHQPSGTSTMPSTQPIDRNMDNAPSNRVS